jgi:hypothetical protein
MDQENPPLPMPRSPPAPPELSQELEDLVFDYLERVEGARSDLLEALCREHPSQADLLRARVQVLRWIGIP